jgi:hypothetical protein
MSTTKSLAFALAGAVMLIAAAPADAAVRTKSTARYGAALAPGAEAFAQGSRNVNQNGAPFRTPPACAYPLRYDSGGVAVFNRQNCRLP